jgi:diguanylate cyclase (GGDEF)-like protein
VLVAALIVLASLLGLAAVVFGTLAISRGRRQHQLQDAVAALARSWSEDGSSRGRVCAAAQQGTGADLAFLAEPTRRGDALQITATSDASVLSGLHLEIDGMTSLAGRAFLTGAPIHTGDLRRAPTQTAEVLEPTRARSLHLRPVHRDGRIVGILGLGWRDRKADLTGPEYELVAVLGDEVARSIERDAHVALLARQARTDELTALPNRRAWNEAVITEMARAQRTGQPLCVALLDLDHFKAYNDAYGHPTGDAHLRRTATEWRRELRAIDVLARYGGEEFGVLLPNTDIEMAQEVIDRVRQATPNGQTASAGVVAYDMRESRESLLARADAALYRAKHAGRATTVPA